MIIIFHFKIFVKKHFQRFSSGVNIIAVANAPNANFLTGLLWDSPTQSLYAVDLISPEGTNSIYRYDLKTGQMYGAQITGEESPNFILPIEGCDNEFIVGLLYFAKVIRWDGVSATATVLRTLFEVEGHLDVSQVDDKGRLFTGTFNDTVFCSAPAEFAAYRYANSQLTKIISNTRLTTGWAIDYKRNKLYYTDACTYQIQQFDYDFRTGDISKYFAFFFKCFFESFF